MPKRSKRYEVTLVGPFVGDKGQERTRVLTERQAVKEFGRDEWKEVKANYLPHIVVVEL